MALKNEIEILVKAEVGKAIKNIKKVEGQSKKSTKNMSKGISGLKGSYLALAGVVTGVAAGMYGLIKIGQKLLNAYAIQEKAELTLAAAMEQAGTYTKEAMEHNKAYAASLQKMTTYGDEAILGVQKMLTNFGVEGEMLDKLTKSTLDLAAAKGMDLKAASDLVAKSVGSTTNALTRYGISVEGAAGSTERCNMAAENITKLFGGAAQAEANTFAGSIQQLQNIAGDLAEKLGGKLIPIMTPLIGTFKKLLAPTESVNDITKELIKAERELAKVQGKLDDTTQDLTRSEKGKLEVRKAELQLKIVELINKQSRAYAKNIKKIDELKQAIVRVKDAQITQMQEVKKADEKIKGLNKKSIMYYIQERIYNNDKKLAIHLYNIELEKEAKYKLELAKINQDIADTEQTLAVGLKEKLVNKEMLISLDKDLIAKAIEMSETISLTADGEVQTEKDKVDKLKAIQEEYNSYLVVSDEEKKAKKEADAEIAEAERIAKLEKLITDLENETMIMAEEEEKRKELLKQIRDDIDKSESERRKKRIMDWIKEQKRKVDVARQYASAMNVIGDSIYQLELNRLQEREKAGHKATERDKERLKKIWIVNKRLSQGMAVINAAAAVLTTMKSVPYPANIPLAIAQGVAGGLQVAIINKQKMPKFAMGTMGAPGGMALVGEQGPEVVSLPRGSKVYSAGQTQDIVNNNNRNIDFEGAVINLPNVQNAEDFMNELEEIEQNTNSNIFSR